LCQDAITTAQSLHYIFSNCAMQRLQFCRTS
jgi:hypothetical protein